MHERSLRLTRWILGATLALVFPLGMVTIFTSFSRTQVEHLQQEDVLLEALPTDIESFLALRDRQASNPQGAALSFLAAILIYGKDKDLGEACVLRCLAADSDLVDEGPALSPRARFFLEQLADRPWIAKSCINNCNPADKYAEPPFPWQFTLSRNRYSLGADGSLTLYITSSGASSPRPMDLAKTEQGYWRIRSFSSLVCGVRKPPVQRPDPFPGP